ncbi:contractile injection system protein, VgrG/Pvc8 family [Novosphingobium sp.]|uniref:contractile injection system protein, VgrG/Pvc8 family n=1 Tax=Novosphingobium sp. TaxID=1874826 RepID=UPI0031D718BF
MTGYVNPKPAWKVTLGNKDLTEKMAPRIISLTLVEDTGEKADRLEICLSDHDGKLAMPKKGALLAVSLGWERGTGVKVGLVSKGTFKVDGIGWGGGVSQESDTITISARSADLAGSFRKRKNKSHHGQTLGQIVAAVAAANGLTAKCHPDLASVVVTSAEQAHKSDMQFLRDLGRRYDAAATVKAGRLIFSPHSAKTTAGGKTLPTLTITRQMGGRPEYEESSRDSGQNGAEAQYFDQSTGKRVVVGAGGSTRKRLKRIYSSKADAAAAAGSESNRLARRGGRLKFTLSYGDPAVAAGARAKVSGFKAEIDAKAWRMVNVQHNMSKDGYTTDLDMELAG